MLTTESILQSVIGPRLIQDIRTSQLDRGLVASGKSSKSLSFTVEREGQRITFTVIGSSSWYFQQNGRRPNAKKGRPSNWLINVIREWIQVKNLSIPLAAAGAIAYKITNEGIHVPNRFNRGGVLSEPLNKGRIVSLLKPDLLAHYVDSFTSQLFAA